MSDETDQVAADADDGPTFTLAAVQLALAAKISPEAAHYAGIIAQTLDLDAGPATASDGSRAAKLATVGVVLAALGGNILQARHLALAPLVSVALSVDGAALRLGADEALATPLLNGWLKTDFEMAATMPVWTGAVMAGQSGLPYFESVELCALEGEMCGAVVFYIGGVRVGALYGAAADDSETFLQRGGQVLATFTGDELYQLGALIVAAENLQPEDRLAAVRQAVKVPASVTVH